MLNQVFKQRWLEKLRSGKYTQAKGRLWYQGLDDIFPPGYISPPGGYCCLGVAACILVEAGVAHWDIKEKYDAHLIFGQGGPYGQLGGFDPVVLQTIGLGQDEQAKLINLNDSEDYSFSQIADWIEENL